jgi:hypothetical protein
MRLAQVEKALKVRLFQIGATTLIVATFGRTTLGIMAQHKISLLRYLA